MVVSRIHEPRHWCTVLPLGLALALSFISLSRFNTRPRLRFILIAALISCAILHAKSFPFSSSINNLMPLIMMMFLAHQANVHCLVDQEVLQRLRSRQKFESVDKSMQAEVLAREVNASQQFHGDRNWIFAYKMTFNPRLIGTPWEVPNLDKASFARRTRRSFVWQKGIVILCRYLALCLYWDPMIYHRMPDGKPWNAGDFAFDNRFVAVKIADFLISNAAPEDVVRCIVLRLHLVCDHVILTYLTFSAQHDILSIVAVSLRLDSPEEWPPLFGTLRDAYSIRRYWTHFWHLAVYRPFSGMAIVFCEKVLMLSPRSSLILYMMNGMVFVMSGLMHLIFRLVVSSGDPCVWSLCWTQFWGFAIQTLGISLEEFVRKIIFARKERSARHSQKKAARHVNLVWRLGGYLWVICWTVFVIEAFVFPSLMCEVRN